MAAYGDKRDFAKIDLSVYSESLGRWEYVGTTTWSRTCREAADRLAGMHPNLSRSNIRGRFQRDAQGRKVY